MKPFDGTLPYNFIPRPYQTDLFRYMLQGGTHKHAEIVWHRRSGKDEACMHLMSLLIHVNPKAASYWYMLPQYAQARKAVWEAVDPHKGTRRIDSIFPRELRQSTREAEMLIKFKNGATLQIVGSDNYDSLVGSTLGGVVFSEWAIANPAARAFIRPIMQESGGWQIYNGTPRGRNHAANSFEAAAKDPHCFASLVRADTSGVFTFDQLERERQEYLSTYGEALGAALFEQEYMCSFDAAVVGAVYGAEVRKCREEDRLTHTPYDPTLPLFIAADLGIRDATAVWWYQIHKDEMRFIDHEEFTLQSIDDIVDTILDRRYPRPQTIFLPHDAKALSLQTGKTMEEQLRRRGLSVRTLQRQSKMDQVQITRKVWPNMQFDSEKCAQGFDLVAQYKYEYDEKTRVFKPIPLHDFASHSAEALQYAAQAYRIQKEEADQGIKPLISETQMPIVKMLRKQKLDNSRSRWLA